jgi:hypothetical protein
LSLSRYACGRPPYFPPLLGALPPQSPRFENRRLFLAVCSFQASPAHQGMTQSMGPTRVTGRANEFPRRNLQSSPSKSARTNLPEETFKSFFQQICSNEFAGRNFQHFSQQTRSTQPATFAGTGKSPKHRQFDGPHKGRRESQRVSQKKLAKFPQQIRTNEFAGRNFQKFLPTNLLERICRKKLSTFLQTNLLDPPGNIGGPQNGEKIGNSLVPDEAA